MVGLLFEVFFFFPFNDTNIDIVRKNGPIQVQNDYSALENEYAWTSVADYVWIDQPV
jgi:carboxypeptidase D